MMLSLNTDPNEEDLYGGGGYTPTGTASQLKTTKAIRYGLPAEIDNFWRWTLRAVRNDGCSPSIYGTNAYHLATVTSDNYSNCKVSPLSDAPMSYILLYYEDEGKGDCEYAFTPSLTGSPAPSLQMRLGEGLITKSTNCTPRDFTGSEPFLIRQTGQFYYISQGLVTDVINRWDFTKPNYETRPKRPLMIAFTGMTFHVDFIRM